MLSHVAMAHFELLIVNCQTVEKKEKDFGGLLSLTLPKIMFFINYFMTTHTASE